MLKIVVLPKLLLSWIAVISLVPGMSTFSQLFVLRVLLTQITDLTGELFLPRFSGKMGLKFIGVRMALNLLTVCGSCISTISQSLPCTLLSRSRCAFSDLFKLICRMRRVQGGGGGGGGACCVGWIGRGVPAFPVGERKSVM